MENGKRMDTLQEDVSFHGLSVYASQKHYTYNGNSLEERKTACCTNDHNELRPPVFHFLFFFFNLI